MVPNVGARISKFIAVHSDVRETRVFESWTERDCHEKHKEAALLLKSE